MFSVLFYSEFDRYQVQNQGLKTQAPMTFPRDGPATAIFEEGLQAGHLYTVVVKSFSDKVPSWPTTANVTTRPLAVQNVISTTDDGTGDILIEWNPNPASLQDEYKVSSVFCAIANKRGLFYSLE